MGEDIGIGQYIIYTPYMPLAISGVGLVDVPIILKPEPHRIMKVKEWLLQRQKKELYEEFFNRKD